MSIAVLWLALAAPLVAIAYIAKISGRAGQRDLVVQQAAKFELGNQKTANAVDLMIPPSPLLRADEVIQ